MHSTDENPQGMGIATGNGSQTKRVAALTALLVGQFVFLRLVLWPDIPIDDAWITFRYAQNLVEGNGLVFNPGEWVEGYSSLTWTVLMALPALIGLDVATFARIAGFLFGAATTILIGRRSLVAALWLSASVPALYHFSNGLETPLVALLLTGLVLCGRGKPLERTLAVVIAASLTWTRPEGLLAVLLWCVLRSSVRGLDRNLSWPQRLQREAPIMGVAIAAWGLQTGARWILYGDWIANSARAKLLPLGFALPHGLHDLAGFLWTGGAFGSLVLLVAAGVAVNWVRARNTRANLFDFSIANARQVFLIAFALLLSRSGGDSFPMWRFLVPLLPLFVLEAARGLETLTLSRPRRHAAWLHATMTLAVVAGLIFPAAGYLKALRSEGAWVRHWAEVGQQLRKIAPSDAVLALSPAGVLPYHSRLTTIDMLGLNEPVIARVTPDLRYSYPGHQRHAGKHVHDRKPDLIIVGNAPRARSNAAQFPWATVRIYEQDVVRDPRFRSSFRLIHVPLPSGGFAMMFARAELIPKLLHLREGRQPARSR